jgi:bifunctional DNase/RNase
MVHNADVAALILDPATHMPIILLKTADDSCIIPIWIGHLEATSIANAIKEVVYKRPMTHDLFKGFLNRVKFFISKIEICDFKDNTYYSKIHFSSKNKTFAMDARPSDAIALALRFKAPIFVGDKVITQFQDAYGKVDIMNQSEEGKKWAKYLQNLDPDDFGKFVI